jgi:hypothetical protein
MEQCSDPDPGQNIPPDPHWIRIRWAHGSGSTLRIRIRIQKGENQLKKKNKSQVCGPAKKYVNKYRYFLFGHILGKELGLKMFNV